MKKLIIELDMMEEDSGELFVMDPRTSDLIARAQVIPLRNGSGVNIHSVDVTRLRWLLQDEVVRVVREGARS